MPSPRRQLANDRSRSASLAEQDVRHAPCVVGMDSHRRIASLLNSSGYRMLCRRQPIWAGPLSLGEAGEPDEEIDPTGLVSRDLGYVLVGLVALTAGSIALVGLRV